MAYSFHINSAALLRRFAVYVVIAQGEGEALLYVGKTGDNREGCNPLISRCGNHFSYNKIHSQVRNKIPAHESWRYTYVFDHFDEYSDDPKERRTSINRIAGRQQLRCDLPHDPTQTVRPELSPAPHFTCSDGRRWDGPINCIPCAGGGKRAVDKPARP